MLSRCRVVQTSFSVFAEGQPANIDRRLVDQSQDEVILSLRSLTLNDDELPVRRDYGTTGTPIKLRANFFPVKVPRGPLYEYGVSIEPTTNVRRMRRRIFHLAEATQDWANAGMTGRVAHDLASKLIASYKLPSDPVIIKVPFTDEEGGAPAPTMQAAKPKGGKKGGKEARPREYTLTIKFVQALETESLVRYVVISVHISKQEVYLHARRAFAGLSSLSSLLNVWSSIHILLTVTWMVFVNSAITTQRPSSKHCSSS